MDERFRSTDMGSAITYHAFNGVEVRSRFAPTLYVSSSGEFVVSLWGVTTADDASAVTITFSKVENMAGDAEAYKVKILDALKDWAKNWHGFKDDTCEKEPGVYEF
jgi:hypothetical protein